MKLKQIFISAFMLLAGAGTVFSQGSKVEFEEYDLDNGLHVILQQDHSTPNIVVSVMYHVGSKNENANLTGFAHFFEHLMFEGTKNIPRHEYDKYVTRAGGQLNANTSQDRTYYYEKLPSNQLALGLWLESERMLHAVVDSIGIATQKSVVTQEMKQRVDNQPYGTMLQNITANAYKVFPYSHRVLGSEEHVASAKDQDFIDFYKTFYVPNNAVLTVCGDFKMDEAKKLVADYFATIPTGTKVIPRPTSVEPEKIAEIRDTVFDNIQMPAIFSAYHVPANGTPDFYAIEMLSKLLSDGTSSRMTKALVEEKQTALQVAVSPFPFEAPGLVLTVGIPSIGTDPLVLENDMDRIFKTVQNELISEKELQKLQNMVENDIVNSNAAIEHRAENLATSYTYFKDTQRVNAELEKYFSVSREDIQRVAKKYFVPTNRVVLYYLPKKK